MQGDLDETRLVDGLAGARNIYRRRGTAEHQGGDQLLPKRVKFVMDCSGAWGKRPFFVPFRAFFTVFSRVFPLEDVVSGGVGARKAIKRPCRGSMYTFNRIDQRLQRLMEASIFIFESFAGFEHKYEQLGTCGWPI